MVKYFNEMENTHSNFKLSRFTFSKRFSTKLSTIEISDSYRHTSAGHSSSSSNKIKNLKKWPMSILKNINYKNLNINIYNYLTEKMVIFVLGESPVYFM